MQKLRLLLSSLLKVGRNLFALIPYQMWFSVYPAGALRIR